MKLRPLRRPRKLPRLSLPVRIVLGVIGWVLILVGIVGLFLPVVQGGLFLVLGAAVISLVSHRFHAWLRARFAGWPRGWKRVERFRRWLHGKLHRE
ncbi:MAG: hypothetical protein M5U13_18095 [Thermoanaerobaculia bacterium]|nr:hypothetical protein [Thermoanaerobaculia bacterium]